jgi:hypothetical protein
MYPNNNCNNCDDCPPICITFTIDAEAVGGNSEAVGGFSNCATEQAGIYNSKPYYQLYGSGCTQLANIFVWWNIITNRWEFTQALGSGQVLCYNMNPGLYPISNSGFNWIEDDPKLIMVSSLEGPCPGPLPLPDLSGLCGEEYNAACVIYTGEDINCLGIESGMTFLEVLNIFNNALPICDCCEKIPQNCVVSGWGPWGPCECYYEDELLVCGRRKREKTIITPPANGGTPCPPLVEYEPCDVPDVCFTFGSYICDTDPNSTQILESPAGLFNGKPYYLLEFDCEASDLYVWYNSTTLLWHITPVLGTTNALYQTLNNGGNYLPISNNTTQRWSFVEGGNNYLITTQTTTCPDVNICFEFYILTEAVNYTFYANIAPTSLGEGSFPIYQWTNNDAIYGPYTLIVEYSIIENKWVYIVYNSVYTTPLTWGTLDTNTFYPISTSTIEWQPVENIEGYGSQLLSSTQDACTAPPDVDCVWTCTPWSACNAGCTQTRTCTITTPASGNGTCEESPITQQSCCEPSCPQPLSPTVVISGTNVLVTFTAVPGAVGYTLTYSATGGNPTSLTSSLPSFSFPWVCGVTYNGSITTNCGTLTSDPTNFIIEIPPCPQPQRCNGEVTSFISGTFNTPQQAILKINATTAAIESAFPVFSNAINDQFPRFWASDLGVDGLYVGGVAGLNAQDSTGIYYFAGVGKLKCTSTSSILNGTWDKTFNNGLTGQLFETQPGDVVTACVRVVRYEAATNKLYVGGHFAKYRGVNCPKNLVCLDGTTGALQDSTVFKLSAAGLLNSLNGQSSSFVSDIQFDKSDGTTKLVVAGQFDTVWTATGTTISAMHIVRMTLNGTVDPSFAITGTSFSERQALVDAGTFPLNALSYVRTIYVDNIGDIYAGGAFYTYKGVSANNIVKIKKNGSIAPTSEFNSGSGFIEPGNLCVGWASPRTTGTNDVHRPFTRSVGGVAKQGIGIEKIVKHVNGILVAGNFAHYNGSQVNALVKLNLNGTIDTSFITDTTTALNFTVPGNPVTVSRAGYDLVVLSDNRVLFTGFLNNYLGTTSKQAYYVLDSSGNIIISPPAFTTTAGWRVYGNHIMSYLM